MKIEEEIRDWIKSFVKEFKRTSGFLTEWKDPIVSFADVNDPLFTKLKEVIGESHAHPKELLVNASTVIVYFIFSIKISLFLIVGCNIVQKNGLVRT